MNCNAIQPAVITATLAAGSSASPYYAQVNISQRLCYKTCKDVAPVFNPQFSFVRLESVGTNQYVLTALTGVNVAAGSVVNSVAASACQNCSRMFVSETPLTITTTTAA